MITFASYIIPVILALIGCTFLFSKKDYVSEFIAGARAGLETAVKLLPTLVMLIIGITMFRASGALDALTTFLSPAFAVLGIPRELIAFIIMRPISGSGSTAMLNDIFTAYGPDSFVGRVASVIMASGETVFYVFAVYFGAVGVKKTRYALPAALFVVVFTAISATAVVRWLF